MLVVADETPAQYRRSARPSIVWAAEGTPSPAECVRRSRRRCPHRHRAREPGWQADARCDDVRLVARTVTAITRPARPRLPEPGNLRAGLEAIGRRYVALLTQPGMAALFRIVIAEVPRFPELGETQFKLGKMPYFESVRRYLAAENAAGTARLDDAEMAATQFLGMISNYVFWPRMLLARWEPDDSAITNAVDQAVLTMLARYGAPGAHGA